MVHTERSRNAAFLAVAYKLIFLPWARREVMSEHFAASTFGALKEMPETRQEADLKL